MSNCPHCDGRGIIKLAFPYQEGEGLEYESEWHILEVRCFCKFEEGED